MKIKLCQAVITDNGLNTGITRGTPEPVAVTAANGQGAHRAAKGSMQGLGGLEARERGRTSNLGQGERLVGAILSRALWSSTVDPSHGMME